MPRSELYHPVLFYLITILGAAIIGAVMALISRRGGDAQWQMLLLLAGLCVPCVTALGMIFLSGSETLIQDFWARLFTFRIAWPYLAVILFLMPCVVLLATALSLPFGYSVDQFSLTREFSAMKGWSILGICIPLLLAPIIEELGWRGYGVDSLRAYFNLFNTCLLFGLLWAAWHVPAFFIKGYYHNELWNRGIVYVVNFFVSVVVLSFLFNWIYYKTGRSIPAVILFHAVMNLASMALNTEQFTKCIITLLLAVAAFFVVFYDSGFFFNDQPFQA